MMDVDVPTVSKGFQTASKCLLGIALASGIVLVGSLLLEVQVATSKDTSFKAPGHLYVGERPAWWHVNRVPKCSLLNNPFPRDFWFVKTKKVGGSTLAIILENLSRTYGIQPITTPDDIDPMANEEEALLLKEKTQNETGAEYFSLFRHISYAPSMREHLFHDPLLFTATRHPLERAYSQYYYKQYRNCILKPMSGKGCWEDTQEAYMDFLGKNRDFMTNYLRGDKIKTDHKGILDQYDFVFVTERFDESLVLFSLTYGIPLQNVMYYAKEKDMGSSRPYADQKPEWLNNYTMTFYPNDLMLWELANQRLDDQKAAISSSCGPRAVEEALHHFKNWKNS